MQYMTSDTISEEQGYLMTSCFRDRTNQGGCKRLEKAYYGGNPQDIHQESVRGFKPSALSMDNLGELSGLAAKSYDNLSKLVPRTMERIAARKACVTSKHMLRGRDLVYLE